MPELPSTSVSEHFATLAGPRDAKKVEHRLVDILTITLCAVACGADDWVAVATFGELRGTWPRTFLALPGGIPSHDTFGRVFRLLDPDELRRCFPAWVGAVAGAPSGDEAPSPEPGGAGRPGVAVDGKTLRRSHDRAAGEGALHLVSAWATERGLVLGQVATAEKSNEITAIPALLRLLALEGVVVTVDAMGRRTAIAARVVEQGAGYVLALKDNQPSARARLAVRDADAAAGTTLPLADVPAHATVEKGHGRIERRRCQAIGDPAYLAYVDPDGAWPGLTSVVRVESTRRLGDAVSTEARPYLSSLPPDAALLQRVIRGPWGVENRPHRVLDVAVREDLSRTRADHAPENLATVRHLAPNLPRRDPTRRTGIANSRFEVALDPAYLRALPDGVRT